MKRRYQKFFLIGLLSSVSFTFLLIGITLVVVDLVVVPRLTSHEPFVVEPAAHGSLASAVTFPVEMMTPVALRPSGMLAALERPLTSNDDKPETLIGRLQFAEIPQEPLIVSEDEAEPAAELALVTTSETTIAPTAVPTEPPFRPTQTVPPPTEAAVEPPPPAETPLPQPTEPAESPTPIPSDGVYIVRYGDSLLSIANKLGVPKPILMEINGLTEQSIIHAGDQLKIPDTTHLGVPYVGQVIWPVEARYIIKQYRYGHRAIDIVLPSGSPVVAMAAGTIEYAGWSSVGYGYMVLIDHGNEVHTLYAHNSAFHVKVGDVVEQGQLIADSGNTGNSTMPHLHLEIRAGGQMLNPCLYLPDGC